jgi:hypothetical protein
MQWLVMSMARRRWSWFLFALPVFTVGVLVLSVTHPLHYIRVGGTVTSYREITTFTNSYDHNELRIAGAPRTYALDKWDLHPRLLEGVPVGAQVSIWVEPDNRWIQGITIGDAHAKRAERTTDFYDHPAEAVRNNYIGAGVFFGIGGLLCLNSLLWRLLPWNRPPASRYVPTYMPTYLTGEDPTRW